MKYAYALAAAAAVMAPMPAFASTNILVNGGFETPDVPGSCCTTTPPAPLPGWNVLTGNVNVVEGTFASTNGNLAFENLQYLDLVGQGGVGSMEQTFNTIEGMIYNLTFAYSHNLFAGAFTAEAIFNVGDLAGTISHGTGSNANLDWKIFSGNFTGTGSPMTLYFENTVAMNNEGIFLDGVSVTATPEPSTWLMLILGFGLAGSAVRSARRRKVGAFA